MRPTPDTLRAALFLVSGATFAACKSAAEQEASADRAVYAILEQRRNELFAHDDQFTIEPPPDSLRQRLLRGETVEPLSLVDALEIAAENSRDYQQQKETLYLTALDLTLARYAFQVQQNGEFGALINGDFENGATDAAVTGDYALTKLLGTGAAIIGNIGFSLARTLTSSDDWDLTSNYAFSVTQPLLRGFGERIVKEPLTQAERDVVYQVRSFERFRRTFAVDVCSRYLRILQQHDQVANEERNYANLLGVRERNQELANAGRLSDIRVDQARQEELRSENTLIEQRQRLETSLDAFKLFLGLPVESVIDVRVDALDKLTRENAPLIDERTAIDAALLQRLDYMTALDRVDDRDRKVDVAADGLRAALDVTGRVSGESVEGQPLYFERQDAQFTVGATLDLPIDRLRERNIYREALINRDQARRDSVELADSITADIRASLREAVATLESLAIQRDAVRLAERLVESTRLNFDAGRAETRDILEAQDELVQAQNAVTAARIDHHLARLALWRDIEALTVDENGIALDTQFAAPQGTP
jgi:outer membrane protein TolC